MKIKEYTVVLCNNGESGENPEQMKDSAVYVVSFHCICFMLMQAV